MTFRLPESPLMEKASGYASLDERSQLGIKLKSNYKGSGV